MFLFYKPKPEPPLHRNETLIPESKANLLQRISVGWVFPLLRTGYTRTIEENDVWSLDESRRAQTLSDLLEAKFYARCPPSRRPLHLGGVPACIPSEKNHGVDAEPAGPPEDFLVEGLAVDAPVLDRTLSLAQNVSRTDTTHYDKTIRKSKGGDEPQADSKTSLSTLVAIFAILSRLNPWSTYRKVARLEKGNKVVETDEQGKKRVYDSSLVKALILSCWKRLLFAVACKACHSVLITTSSLITKRLITYISVSHEWSKADEADRGTRSLSKPKSIGYGIGIAISLAAMQEVASLFENHYSAQSMTCGFMMRNAIINQIARKSLRLSPPARIEFTNGKQITAMTADSGYVEWSFPLIVNVLVEPITIIIGFALLLVNLGPSALVGIGVLAMSSPVMAILFKDMRESRQQQLKVMDKRVRLTSEVLSAIRQIKLYAYEAYFEKRMLSHRGQELARLRKNIRSRSTLFMITTLIPTLAAVLSFIVYSLTGHELRAASIFASLQLFNIIQSPMSELPMVITALADAHVAIVRISKILTAEEQPHGLIISPEQEYGLQVSGDFTYETAAPPDHNDVGRLSLSKKKAKGSKKTKDEPDSDGKVALLEVPGEKENEEVPFTLRGIDLRIPRGALVCIFGRIGSGKSALLEGILGEMRQTCGHVLFGGDVSLVTQTPWIQNASVRDNIIFGKDVDEKRLADAVRACALTRDLEGLVDGIHTEIGERGINLSGGQRSRIALARATYANAEVVLLDDPLSAVDSHVSSHLVKECFLGVLRHKTRILVTHHLEVAQHADLVLVMENGSVIQQGSYAELKNIEGNFQTLLKEYGNDTGSSTSQTEMEPEIEVEAEIPDEAPVMAKDGKEITKIHMDEEQEEGAISGKTYAAYGKAMMKGGPLLCAMVCVALSEVAQVGNTLALGFWSSSSIKGFNQGQYMGIYAGLGMAIAFFTFIAAYTAALSGLGASFLMFQQALRRVLRSPTVFHDRTPSGRIVSRLTKDVERVDIFLPREWFELIQGLASIVGMVVLVFYSFPWLGIILIPLFACYYVFGTFYRFTARELKRINSTTRSFVYSGFNEQLAGTISIRAYQEQPKFIEDISQAMNRESRFYYSQIFVGIWLTLRLDLLGSLLIMAIAIFGVCFRNKVEPTKLSVLLTYSLQTTQLFSQLVLTYTRVEREMNTCERLLYYGQLPLEADPVKPNDPDQLWPSKGEITLDDVELKYRPELPAVLKGLSVQIRPGEKIGIVGRTGAGKSSCLQALFRLVELSRGRIIIDGVNLADIGLDTLRKNLSAIPQEPLLYSGTMRENLDPEDVKTDAELYDALQRCGLIDTTSEQSQRFNKFKLDAQVSDEGGNFSGGERQLVALCRALVKNRKVLMLDEATSSVDPETDATIQKTIQTEFGDVTLLCIAHRLATIAFYDRVLVLEKGNVAEFDTPLNLYDQQDSIFRGMCDAAKLDREAILKIRNQGT